MSSVNVNPTSTPIKGELTESDNELMEVLQNFAQNPNMVAQPPASTPEKKGSAGVDGELKPVKTPNKQTPKEKQGGTDANAVQNHDGREGSMVAAKATPKKRGPKAKPKGVTDGDGNVGEPSAKSATPKVTSVKKRTPKGKAEPSGEEYGSTEKPASSKKRVSTKEAGEDAKETPTKKPRGAIAPKSKMPTSREELSDADALLLKMKKDGNTWAEINAAYTNITGVALGKSALPVRYARIMDALAEWKQGDLERMLHAKDQVDKETEEAVIAFKKKAENEVWAKMAKVMADIGGDDYTGGAVEKAYQKEKKEGFPHRVSVAAVLFHSSGPDVQNGHDDDAGKGKGVKHEEQDVEVGVKEEVYEDADMDEA